MRETILFQEADFVFLSKRESIITQEKVNQTDDTAVTCPGRIHLLRKPQQSQTLLVYPNTATLQVSLVLSFIPSTIFSIKTMTPPHPTKKKSAECWETSHPPISSERMNSNCDSERTKVLPHFRSKAKKCCISVKNRFF